MITPDDFEPVYEFAPAPRMPGVRRLGCAREEKYRLAVDLDADEPNNFIPPPIPSGGGRRCGERWRRRPPVMAATGIGLEPFEVSVNIGFICTLLIIILIIWLVYNTANK